MSTKLTLLSAAIFSLSVSATTLPVLVSSSDAVVVGTEFNPVQVGGAFRFYLTVERVLSGNIPTGTTLDVVWNSRTNARLGYNDDKISYRGIWFLKKASDGGWECISAGSSGNAEFFFALSLPAPEGPLPAELFYDPATTPLEDKVLLEMVAGPPRANRQVLLQIIAGNRSPGALRAFKYLTKSQAHDQVLTGITALLQADDAAGLQALDALGGQIKPDEPGIDSIVFTLRFLFKGTDPAAISSLGRMATSDKTVPVLRDASANSLVKVHSAEAVPWLGMLLDSDSEQMQIYGAQGLSFFVNGVGIPNPQTVATLDHLNNRQSSRYRTEETDRHIGYTAGQSKEFVQFWKNWWNEHPELHTPIKQ